MNFSTKATKMNKRSNKELTEREELDIKRGKKLTKHNRSNRKTKQEWDV